MTDWLIYSNEHRAFWKPQGWGYSTAIDQAGRYSEAEARDIVKRANIAVREGEPPNEVMILAPSRDQIEVDRAEEIDGASPAHPARRL